MLSLLILFAFTPSAFSAPTFGPEFELQAKNRDTVTTICALAPMGYAVVDFRLRNKINSGTVARAGLISTSGILTMHLCDMGNNKWKASQLAKVIQKTCEARGDCKVTKIKAMKTYGGRNPDYNKVYKVEYNDGYWFQINTDPGVVEIQAKAEDAARTKELTARIQRDIFDSAEAAKLQVLRKFGAGHINIGFASADFEKDPLLFRNFIVDFINHYEISNGVLNKDKMNAQSPLEIKEVREKLKKIIARFDSGEIKTSEELATELHRGAFHGKGRGLSLSIRRIAKKFIARRNGVIMKISL